MKCGYAGFISLRLSKRLHFKMIWSLLNAKPQRLMSRIPQGVVMNRFSKDVETIDKTMHDILPWGTGVMFQMITTIIVIYFALGNLTPYS